MGQQRLFDVSPSLHVLPRRQIHRRFPWHDACDSPCTCACLYLCCDYDCDFVSCLSNETYHATSNAICLFWSTCVIFLCRDPGLCRWTWTVYGSVPGTIGIRYDGAYVAPGAVSRSVRIYCFDGSPWQAKANVVYLRLCSCGCHVSWYNLCYTWEARAEWVAIRYSIWRCVRTALSPSRWRVEPKDGPIRIETAFHEYMACSGSSRLHMTWAFFFFF